MKHLLATALEAVLISSMIALCVFLLFISGCSQAYGQFPTNISNPPTIHWVIDTNRARVFVKNLTKNNQFSYGASDGFLNYPANNSWNITLNCVTTNGKYVIKHKPYLENPVNGNQTLIWNTMEHSAFTNTSSSFTTNTITFTIFPFESDCFWLTNK